MYKVVGDQKYQGFPSSQFNKINRNNKINGIKNGFIDQCKLGSGFWSMYFL